MATQPKPNPITADQYETFAGAPGYRDELINGRIVMTPDAKPLHQHIQKNIQRLLEAACQDSGYIVNGDSNIKLTHIDMPSPDVFVVTASGWLHAMRTGQYLNEPPLLAVEILSPSQYSTSPLPTPAGPEMVEKIHVYLAAHVEAIWIVDPKNRVVTFYENGKPYREIGELALPSPLKGSIQVSAMFDGLPKNSFA